MTQLTSRQNPNSGISNDPSDQQFYDDAVRAVIIKWAVIGGIFSLLLLWIVIGHIHARRRLRKGLPLLTYHKYLVSASSVPSPYAANTYRLQRVDDPTYYAPPPPIYDPKEPSPPSYQPPSYQPPTERQEPQVEEEAPKPTPSQVEQQATTSPQRSFIPKSWRPGNSTS